MLSREARCRAIDPSRIPSRELTDDEYDPMENIICSALTSPLWVLTPQVRRGPAKGQPETVLCVCTVTTWSTVSTYIRLIFLI